MGKIIELPESLSNKIAAGEVVERPASVIKELIENSIDAESSWIKIELQEAGLRSIKVIDNGVGIQSEDVPKAFGRHATSKITNEQDLFRVSTLGFRGEALASIASVSQLTLRTSTGESAGTEIVVHGGTLVEHNKHTKRKGTEITVENLFYNTPARLKYLKTVHTELGHLTDVINRMALSHPDIRFECEHNGKRIFFTPGNGQLLHAVQQIYGTNIAKNMLEVNASSLDYNVQGYIAKPEVTRSNRNYISLIVNGRFVKNPMVNKAILDGYHTFLPIGRYPVVVLKIDMDPYLVDVNVHPAKTEVRFSKEKELFDVIKQAVYDVLHGQRLIPSGVKKEKPKSEQTSLDFSVKRDSTPITEPIQSSFPNTTQLGSTNIVREDESSVTEEPTVENDNINTATTRNTNELVEEQVEQSYIERNEKKIPFLNPIGQLHGTYILAQDDSGLYMVDQHAAQERIKYEFFKQKLGNPIKEVQELSIPLTFEFTQQEVIRIEENQEELEKVGLFLEPFGDNSFLVRSYPSWFPNGEEESIIRDMIDDLAHEQSIDLEKVREEAAILMSCKRSIKANHYLSHEEMSYLIEELRTCQDPFTCPHGRPIVIHFSEYELQRMFKRIM
ncbi:DNA mismatch repair endonuclease MutL [Alkalibacillus haloalkaliphilus]|uniref:DNA mismatch repair endonuclease MutL n=1 Tax=Alkalibacillus haloalkaliphilus TaxID=94136 RepID=UPI000301F054|nr:DNA mismatch repair endonuclease MutL [Alkalibacillus haloalkaliphilus]